MKSTFLGLALVFALGFAAHAQKGLPTDADHKATPTSGWLRVTNEGDLEYFGMMRMECTSDDSLRLVGNWTHNDVGARWAMPCVGPKTASDGWLTVVPVQQLLAMKGMKVGPLYCFVVKTNNRDVRVADSVVFKIIGTVDPQPRVVAISSDSTEKVCQTPVKEAP